MTQTLFALLRLRTTISINRFLYFLCRLPLVGHLVSETLYEKETWKRRLTVPAVLWRILRRLLSTLLTVFPLLFVPARFFQPDFALRGSTFLYVCFWIGMLGALCSSTVLAANEQTHLCVRLLRMSARQYSLLTLFSQALLDFLVSLPAFLGCLLLLGCNLWWSVLAALFFSAISLAGEGVLLLVYKKTGVILTEKLPYVLGVGAACLLAAYLPLWLFPALLLQNWLLSPVLWILLCLLMVLATVVLVRYRGYEALVRHTLSTFYVQKAQLTNARVSTADVEVREKEFSAEQLQSHRFENKRGYAYLNGLFFARHRRILVRPILRRVAVIVGLFAAAMVAGTVRPEIWAQLPKAGVLLPTMVFWMYLLSIGERVCKAMFCNCDCSLLRYAFYRKPEAVLSNFRVRLLWIAGLNGVVTAALSAAIAGLVLWFHIPWSAADLLLFIFALLLLSLFFSVHHLFLYYVFQPYTSEFGMKNPFYSGLNAFVYLVAVLCVQIQNPPAFFTLLVLLLTAAYIVAALFLVYRFAPKTFRIK